MKLILDTDGPGCWDELLGYVSQVLEENTYVATPGFSAFEPEQQQRTVVARGILVSVLHRLGMSYGDIVNEIQKDAS